MLFSIPKHIKLQLFQHCLSVASLLKNTGLVVANDAKRERTKALVANIHRLGELMRIQNSLFSNDRTERLSTLKPDYWAPFLAGILY